MDAPATVFFLSDYGHRDEFVGVVHAVLRRLVPAVRVIDLTHEVPAFDVRAGAGALTRCLPHLGPGVVLAVVDPGVGGDRRGVAVEAPAGPGPRWFVGPDNGLLASSVDAGGGAVRAAQLGVSRRPGGDGRAPATFDGRDLFAPAAAALCGGSRLADLGPAVEAASLVRLPPALCERRRLGDGHVRVRAEVTWVDRFGNVQLAAGADAAPTRWPTAELVTRPGGHDPEGGVRPVRHVGAFAELSPGEIGLLADANGHLALVVGEGSAARRLGLSEGDLVELVWAPPPDG